VLESTGVPRGSIVEADVTVSRILKRLAAKAGKEPYQIALYVDGTKTMFEMTSVVDDLTYLKTGNGRFSTFFRPCHLWFLEAPLSVAQAAIRRETWL